MRAYISLVWHRHKHGQLPRRTPIFSLRSRALQSKRGALAGFSISILFAAANGTPWESERTVLLPVRDVIGRG